MDGVAVGCYCTVAEELRMRVANPEDLFAHMSEAITKLLKSHMAGRLDHTKAWLSCIDDAFHGIAWGTVSSTSDNSR